MNILRPSKLIQTAIRLYDRAFGGVHIHDTEKLRGMPPKALARHIVRLEMRTVKSGTIKSPFKYGKELLIRIAFDLLIPILIATVIYIQAYAAIPLALLAIFGARRLYVNYCKEVEKKFSNKSSQDDPNVKLVERCIKLQEKYRKLQQARKDSNWSQISLGMLRKLPRCEKLSVCSLTEKDLELLPKVSSMQDLTSLMHGENGLISLTAPLSQDKVLIVFPDGSTKFALLAEDSTECLSKNVRSRRLHTI